MSSRPRRRSGVPRPEIRCSTCGHELKRYWRYCPDCARFLVWGDGRQETGAECYRCRWIVSRPVFVLSLVRGQHLRTRTLQRIAAEGTERVPGPREMRCPLWRRRAIPHVVLPVVRWRAKLERFRPIRRRVPALRPGGGRRMAPVPGVAKTRPDKPDSQGARRCGGSSGVTDPGLGVSGVAPAGSLGSGSDGPRSSKSTRGTWWARAGTRSPGRCWWG